MEMFPAMALADWAETKQTLHRFLQVVGKIRLTASPQRNHWWHVPFHLTGRGLTTRPMGRVDGNPIFTIDFDFVDHQAVLATLDGRQASFPLYGQSVASFWRTISELLTALGIRILVEKPFPFDLSDSERSFADDTEHASYDPAAVNRYWRVLSEVGMVLEEFAQRYSGKTSPVHHFWHTMDIAVTRFSERRIDHAPEVDRVVREAYSREVISFGFWFGDDTSPAPAFYAYTAPEPEGVTDEPLVPASAWWGAAGDSHLALLSYDDVRMSDDPRGTVLAFYESAYQAGAHRAGWDSARYACPGGITDPRASVRR